jgi:hypothetical protein
LARDFEINEFRGIVISNSTGELQAFRHEGNLRNEDLTYYLERFSDPNLAVSHTQTNPPERNHSAPVVEYQSFSTTRSC